MHIKLRWGNLVENRHHKDGEEDGRWAVFAIFLNPRIVTYFKLHQDRLPSHPFEFISPHHPITGCWPVSEITSIHKLHITNKQARHAWKLRVSVLKYHQYQWQWRSMWHNYDTNDISLWRSKCLSAFCNSWSIGCCCESNDFWPFWFVCIQSSTHTKRNSTKDTSEHLS